MSDFERELRRAKEEQRRQAELQRKEEERASRQREANRLMEIKADEAKRKADFERYVKPLKPMVDGMLRDLGNATWGRFGYGFKFEMRDGYGIREDCAVWAVGRTHYGVDKGHWIKNPYFDYSRNEGFNKSENYYVALYYAEGRRFFGSRGGNTLGVSESELRDLLRNEMLEGPIESYPSSSVGRGDGPR